MMTMKKILYKIAFAFVIIVLSGCQKPIECPVPGVELFSFDIDVENSALMTSINSITMPNYGYKKHGVIIYRHNYEHELFAYDATCVDNLDCMEHGIVSVDADNHTLGKCQRCGAHYTFTDGIHTQKRVRLRAYNIFRISNTETKWRISNR
jgi:hypothetical protein